MTTLRDASRPDVGIGLILASASPRRRALLERLGLPFEVQAADVDECALASDGGRPADLVARLSCAKAQAVAALHPQAVVIGADTIVTLEDEILGKPGSPEKATAMLRCLRDRAHQVYSGICVYPGSGGRPEVAVVESTVWMRAYTDDEIAAYVASGSPMDKAGAYGIQDAEFHPVSRLRGCYASVMGLPLCHLAQLLCRPYGRYGRVGGTGARPCAPTCARRAPMMGIVQRVLAPTACRCDKQSAWPKALRARSESPTL